MFDQCHPLRMLLRVDGAVDPFGRLRESPEEMKMDDYNKQLDKRIAEIKSACKL